MKKSFVLTAMAVILCLSFLSRTSFANGPLGKELPGPPVEPIPTHTPLNKKAPKDKPVPDSAIYTALNVAAKNSVKTVGGLSCSSAKCTLAARHEARTIYIALKLPEKNVTSALVTGSKTYAKKVGRLFCSRTAPKQAKAFNSYFCSLH